MPTTEKNPITEHAAAPKLMPIPMEPCKFCRHRVREEDICCYCGGCMSISCADEGENIHIPCCECPEWEEVAK